MINLHDNLCGTKEILVNAGRSALSSLKRGLSQLDINFLKVPCDVKMTDGICLVPVRRFPSPYRSIYFGYVPEANERETSLLGPRDPKRFGRAE